MNLVDEFRMYVSAYYGVEIMDEYPLKIYALKLIEDRIREIINKYNLSLNFEEEIKAIESRNEIEKINDALYVMRSLNYNMDFILMLNHKLKELKSSKN